MNRGNGLLLRFMTAGAPGRAGLWRGPAAGSCGYCSAVQEALEPAPKDGFESLSDVRVGLGAVLLIANDGELMHPDRSREVLLRHAAAQALVAYPAAQSRGRDQELVRVSFREGLLEALGQVRQQPAEDSRLDVAGFVPLHPSDRVAGQARDLRESLQGNTETLPEEPQPGSDCCPLRERTRGVGRGNKPLYFDFGSPICPFGDPDLDASRG